MLSVAMRADSFARFSLSVFTLALRAFCFMLYAAVAFVPVRLLTPFHTLGDFVADAHICALTTGVIYKMQHTMFLLLPISVSTLRLLTAESVCEASCIVHVNATRMQKQKKKQTKHRQAERRQKQCSSPPNALPAAQACLRSA